MRCDNLKKGDFVRISPQDGWQTSEFGWDSDDFYREGRYGVVIGIFNRVFNRPYGYNTWKIRLINGNLAVYPEKELEILAKG
jgi:hypothetical protein